MEIGINLGNRRETDAFSSIRAKNRPPKIVLLGDSIASGDGAPGGTNGPGSWLSRASLYLDGRVIFAGTYGYSGQTAIGHDSAAYRNDFLATNPDIVVFHYGQNSMPASGTLSGPARTAYRNASLNIIRSARAAGAVVITPFLCATSSSSAEIAAHNAWLVSISGAEGTIVGPNFTTAYPGAHGSFTFDGTHPNYAGSEVLARTFADWLAPRLDGVRTWRELCVAAGSAGRMIDREGIATFSAGGGYSYGSPAGTFTESQMDSGLDQPSLRIVKTGGRGIMLTQVPTSASANKWYIASLRIRASMMASDSALMAFATAYPAEFHSAWTWSQIDTGSDWGTVTMLLKTPVGSTQVDYKMRIEPISWSANSSTGIIEFAEGKLYDAATMATALGIDWNLPV